MAVPDTSISPRILSSAKKAFLLYGYDRANLKDICADAGVTTGALYKRYKGKEELFCALVDNAVKDLYRLMEDREGRDPGALSDRDLLQSWDMYSGSGDSFSMQSWFDYLYARKEEFTLLLTCSAGTRYAGLLREWVSRMTAGTYRYLEECVRRGMVSRPMSAEELEVLLSAFWTMIYEPFLRSFSKDQLDIHCGYVCRMFNWKEILGLHLNA